MMRGMTSQDDVAGYSLGQGTGPVLFLGQLGLGLGQLVEQPLSRL